MVNTTSLKPHLVTYTRWCLKRMGWFKTLVLDTKKGYFEEDVEPRTFIEPSIV